MSNTLEDMRFLLDGGASVKEAADTTGLSRQTYYSWLNSLSATDKEAEEKFPGYHTFSEETEKRCANCKRAFKTRLSMNRFCSWGCRPLSREGALRRETAGL